MRHRRTRTPATQHCRHRLIAIFGRARLVRDFDGCYHLQGGNWNDRADAREWTSMFLPEAVVSTQDS